MSSDKSTVPSLSRAEAELQALLTEIPTWDDALLVHMHKRYGASRLFRVHHAPDGPLTPRAQTLLAAVEAEMHRRGLAPDQTSQDLP